MIWMTSVGEELKMKLKKFKNQICQNVWRTSFRRNRICRYLRFRRWTGAEATCCSSAGTTGTWAAGCGCSERPLCSGGGTAGCSLGWTPPCRSWREAAPAGRTGSGCECQRHTGGGRGGQSRTQILWRLIIRSMSSLILRYFSSDSGLWPAESSASMSGLSQPFKPFLRSVWRKKKKKICEMSLNNLIKRGFYGSSKRLTL